MRVHKFCNVSVHNYFKYFRISRQYTNSGWLLFLGFLGMSWDFFVLGLSWDIPGILAKKKLSWDFANCPGILLEFLGFWKSLNKFYIIKSGCQVCHFFILFHFFLHFFQPCHLFSFFNNFVIL